jgi:hypothetical protein
MTEAEWLTGCDPQALLRDLMADRRDRKLRLFACACVRRVWPWVRDRRVRLALEVAERFADGGARWEELAVARHAAREATGRFGGARHPAEFAAFEAAGFSAWFAAHHAAREALHAAQQTAWDVLGSTVAAEEEQCRILRDLFGNPFRPPPVLDPLWAAWNGEAAGRLARAIYDGRRFEDLPVLADALEEAGCEDRLILAHCRDGGEHFRGCWVVDALTGRE